MATVFVNIGSNLGNRRLNLTRAVNAIAKEFGAYELSHVVESTPQGFDSANLFLNIGMVFQSRETPLSILEKLQSIERQLSEVPHRDSSGAYKDREIDIDIIAIDGEIICEDNLSVPHPRLPQRDFFLQPLAELAPGWRHPVSGKTPREMLFELMESSN